MCHHPLFCFNQYGDLEGALLRNGNVHTADDWRSVLNPILARYAGRGMKIFFRGDAIRLALGQGEKENSEFIASEFGGAFAAIILFGWLLPGSWPARARAPASSSSRTA